MQWLTVSWEVNRQMVICVFLRVIDFLSPNVFTFDFYVLTSWMIKTVQE